MFPQSDPTRPQREKTLIFWRKYPIDKAVLKIGRLDGAKKILNEKILDFGFLSNRLDALAVLAIHAAFRLPGYAIGIAPAGLVLYLIFLNGYGEKDGLLASWKF